MKLINGEMIVLEDGNEYIVINTTNINGIEYALLMTSTKPVSMMVVMTEVERDESISVTTVSDQEVIKEVVSNITNAN